MAIHQFDLARLLIGAEPTSVFCRSYNPAWSWYAGDAAASVIFEFGDGATFTFDGSWCAPGVETSWNGAWRFGTARGTATWDGDHAPVAETVDGVRLPAELPDEPEQIAGSLAEFVAHPAGPGGGGGRDPERRGAHQRAQRGHGRGGGPLRRDRSAGRAGHGGRGRVRAGA